MTENKVTTWEQTCNVPFRGLLIESNYSSEESTIRNVKANIETDILFISSNDGVTPTSYQGYNLAETKKIRDYLNNLIEIIENNLSK